VLLLLALTLAIIACAAPCEIGSNLPGYAPQCEGAVLALYPDESRLVVLGSQGGAMVAYLPPDLSAQPYGGTTGRPVTVLVDTDNAQLMGSSEQSRIRVDALSSDTARLTVDVELDEGWIYGPVDAVVEHRQ